MGRLTNTTYTKIALVALLCIVLCGGLLGCSLGCAAVQPPAWNARYSEVGSFELDPAQVKNVQIDWLAGQVQVVVAEGDLITATEEAERAIPDSQRMTWQLQGDTLHIGYGSPAMGIVGCAATPAKRLTLTLPSGMAQQLKTFGISGASGTYEVGAVGCEQLNIELASGRLAGSNLTAQRAAIEIASGQIDLSGSFSQRLSLEAASGKMTIGTDTCPEQCDISVASGNVTVNLPKRSDFTAQVDKMSGSFSCDFPESRLQHHDDTYRYGDGTNRFTIDMASGNVRLAAA